MGALLKSFLFHFLCNCMSYRDYLTIYNCGEMKRKCLKINVIVYNKVRKTVKCCFVIGSVPVNFYNSGVSGSGLKIV